MDLIFKRKSIMLSPPFFCVCNCNRSCIIFALEAAEKIVSSASQISDAVFKRVIASLVSDE
ncbi:hypothetical protein Sjap_013090 [Stephania japonica]|uniref:Uncharacterized protein n=1 Tax=Stephania japonica TaxID=461633 RepID=A0AAP0NYA6_9MAGN